MFYVFFGKPSNTTKQCSLAYRTVIGMVCHMSVNQRLPLPRKAGIVCSLNARTAILASANPADSCYNPKLSVTQLKSVVLRGIKPGPKTA